ncbi:hypothetical protein [Streptomyces canus]|uniref:hypothetical protein n=1 Tax=Streptomyces canus TaxID=58343 RepID=UPI002E2B01A0|nr:hypothetical protein [Streptomyces canus]
MSKISSISSVNGSSFDGRAEAVVVRGCGQAEVRALLTVHIQLDTTTPMVTSEFANIFLGHHLVPSAFTNN